MSKKITGDEAFELFKKKAEKEGFGIAAYAKHCDIDPSTIFRWRGQNNIYANTGLKAGILKVVKV